MKVVRNGSQLFYYYLRWFCRCAVRCGWWPLCEKWPTKWIQSPKHIHWCNGTRSNTEPGISEHHIISFHWILIIVLYCLASVRSFVRNFRRDSIFKLCHWELAKFYFLFCVFFLLALVVVLSFLPFFARILCSRLTGLRQKTSTH